MILKPNDLQSSNELTEFKVVLLGDTAVGKSSLVLRFVKGQFHEFQETTIGAAHLTKTIALDDTSINFQIWDTAGQERYHSLTPMYYRGAHAAIVVYDIRDTQSYSKALKWVDELREKALNRDMIIAIVGNKLDLEQYRVVKRQEVYSYATENNLLFKETSAKTGQNVEELFSDIAKLLPKPVEEKIEVRPTIPEKPPQAKCCNI